MQTYLPPVTGGIAFRSGMVQDSAQEPGAAAAAGEMAWPPGLHGEQCTDVADAPEEEGGDCPHGLSVMQQALCRNK